MQILQFNGKLNVVQIPLGGDLVSETEIFYLELLKPRAFKRMNYTVLGISLLRSSLIAVLALTMAMVIVRYFQSSHTRLPAFFLVLLLLCFFIPTIAIGYGYSYFSFLFIQDPWICNLIYFLIMVCRLTPPAILVLYFIPPTVSENGLHCFNLTLKYEQKLPALLKYWGFMLRGAGRPQIAAVSLLFLLAFTEFELASLMNIESWPVIVFDNHAHGLPVMDSIKLCSVPVMFEFAAIFTFFAIADRGGVKGSLDCNTRKCSAGIKCVAILLMLLGATIIILLPLAMILRYAIPGLSLLFSEFWMSKEIFNSAFFAICGAFAAWILASQLVKFYDPKTKYGKKLLMWVLIPGLLGALPLGLLMLRTFQVSGWHILYDTPLPLILALALFLLPYTFIVLLLLKTIISGESVHLARITVSHAKPKQKADELLWQLVYRGRFWLFFLILSRGFFDLTLAGILAPTGMPTVSIRLYNLMHYGESEKLSATVLLTIIIPLISVLFARLFIKKGIAKCFGN